MSDWPKWKDAFASVIDERYYSIDWLELKVSSGTALLWSSDAAAIVAEVRFYPSGATDLHGLVAAGDVASITDELIPRAEAWAAKAGCLATVIESREAWGRLLKGAGYALYQTAYRKEL